MQSITFGQFRGMAKRSQALIFCIALFCSQSHSKEVGIFREQLISVLLLSVKRQSRPTAWCVLMPSRVQYEDWRHLVYTRWRQSSYWTRDGMSTHQAVGRDCLLTDSNNTLINCSRKMPTSFEWDWLQKRAIQNIKAWDLLAIPLNWPNVMDCMLI